MAKLPRLGSLAPEDVKGLTLADMMGILRRAGIEPDEAAIRAEADAVFARVGVALENGHEDLDEATWQALEARAGRAMDNAIRWQVKGAVRDLRMEAIRESVTAPLVWIATMTNTCDSCVERHGTIMSLPEWEAEGMPGDSVLICDGNCNCQLMPIGEEGGGDVYAEMAAALPDVEVQLAPQVKG